MEVEELDHFGEPLDACLGVELRIPLGVVEFPARQQQCPEEVLVGTRGVAHVAGVAVAPVGGDCLGHGHEGIPVLGSGLGVKPRLLEVVLVPEHRLDAREFGEPVDLAVPGDRVQRGLDQVGGNGSLVDLLEPPGLPELGGPARPGHDHVEGRVLGSEQGGETIVEIVEIGHLVRLDLDSRLFLENLDEPVLENGVRVVVEDRDLPGGGSGPGTERGAVRLVSAGGVHASTESQGACRQATEREERTAGEGGCVGGCHFFITFQLIATLVRVSRDS